MHSIGPWHSKGSSCSAHSTTCVLSLNLWTSFIPRKESRLFLCHPNGRVSQILDDEEAPEEPYNVNMLMSTTKFGFKDTSQFGRASTYVRE